MVELETISWVSSLRLVAIWFPRQIWHWHSCDTSALLLALPWLIHSLDMFRCFIETDVHGGNTFDLWVCINTFVFFESNLPNLLNAYVNLFLRVSCPFCEYLWPLLGINMPSLFSEAYVQANQVPLSSETASRCMRANQIVTQLPLIFCPV